MNKPPSNLRDSQGSFAFWNRAKDCLDAAKLLRRHSAPKNPEYLLLCLAIELALKGFLRGLGATPQELKKEFGHDIAKLYIESEKKGLKIRGFHIGSNARNAIVLAADYFIPKDFTYTAKSISLSHELRAIACVAEAVVGAVEKPCRENMELHSGSGAHLICC